MFSDAPPSRDEVTTSCTWADCVDVKTFTSSGMIAPARVPQVTTVDSCHQSELFPPRSGISSSDRMYVSTTETIEVTHTSSVSGASKCMRATEPYRARLIAFVPR